MLKGKSSTQVPIESVGITSVSKGAAKVEGPRLKTGPLSSIGSTFFAKREC